MPVKRVSETEEAVRMKEYLPRDRHQGIALALYAVVIALLKVTVLPLLLLVCAHLGEYLTISRKLAGEKGLSQRSAMIHTLLYGFTWWKPLRDE